MQTFNSAVSIDGAPIDELTYSVSTADGIFPLPIRWGKLSVSGPRLFVSWNGTPIRGIYQVGVVRDYHSGKTTIELVDTEHVSHFHALKMCKTLRQDLFNAVTYLCGFTLIGAPIETSSDHPWSDVPLF